MPEPLELMDTRFKDRAPFGDTEKEFPPREVTSSSLTDANLTFSSSFIILNYSAKPSSFQYCIEHENLPFPLVKRCQEFLRVHGHSLVFRRKRNSKDSRNGSRSLFLPTLVWVRFKNLKLNRVLNIPFPFAKEPQVILKYMEGCLVTTGSLAVQENLAFFFFFCVYRIGRSGKSNRRQGSLRN